MITNESWILSLFSEKSVKSVFADWPLNVFFDAISKRIELESWDWSQIEEKTI